MRLQKLNAVVTGGARGIGKAIAGALAAEGAKVAIVDILEDELGATIEAFRCEGIDVRGYKADITSITEVRQVADAILSEFKCVDILINNAGTFSVIGPIWEVDPTKWFRDIRVNLFGTFLMCNALVGGMVERKSGYVINMASSGGVSDPHAHMTSYATSKTGIVRLTEGLAKELQDFNVKVFAIGPPAILTDMTRFIMNDEGGQKWRPGFKEIFETGKNTDPDVICRLVVRLVSGDADALSGRFIPGLVDLDATLERIGQVTANDLLLLRIRQLPNL